MSLSVLSDAPARRDILGFDRYSWPLKSVLTSPTLDTPFTIGIFGAWGTGKSTLLQILERELRDYDEDGCRFVCIRFNPWMYRKEPNILIPLLNALRDALNESPIEQARQSGMKIFDVLARLGADLVLKHFTAGAVDLEKLDKLEKVYLERRGEAENQMQKLRSTLENEACRMKAAGVRIAFFIDDLDRCEPQEMIDVLESMKLFLDIENMVHVLALDKEVIDRGISIRYEKFSFAGGRERSLGIEYLDKMIQMPVYLYPLSTEQIEGYVRALDQSPRVLEQMELLRATMSPNPRKIKRVLNVLAWTNYLFDLKPEFGGFDRFITTALAIIRVEEPVLYLEAASEPMLLVALEEVYAGDAAGKKRDAKSGNSFTDFGARSEAMRALCATWYQPSGMLAKIFAPRKFGPARDRLADYLSVAGRC